MARSARRKHSVTTTIVFDDFSQVAEKLRHLRNYFTAKTCYLYSDLRRGTSWLKFFLQRDISRKGLYVVSHNVPGWLSSSRGDLRVNKAIVFEKTLVEDYRVEALARAEQPNAFKALCRGGTLSSSC